MSLDQKPSPNKSLSRPTFLTLLTTALHVGAYNYAHQLSIGWLGFYPGDLEVNLLNAKALINFESVKYNQHREANNTGKFIQNAQKILARITEVDPEFLDAHRLCGQIERSNSSGLSQTTLASLQILDNLSTNVPALTADLLVFRQMHSWLSDQARPLSLWENEALPQLGESSAHLSRDGVKITKEVPLAASLHIRTMMSQRCDAKQILNLVETYLDLWPRCVSLKISLAELLMTSNPDEAVSILHEAVSLDTTGQVPKRFWGDEHPYLQLWPKFLEVSHGHPNSPQSIAVPASVSAALGWNQLPISTTGKSQLLTVQSREKSAEPHKRRIPNQDRPVPGEQKETANRQPQPRKKTIVNERPTAIQEISTLKNIASKVKQPALGKIDGRFPVYVILTTWRGLAEKYGEAGAHNILSELQILKSTVAKYRQWDSLILTVDDPAVCPDHRIANVAPARWNDPWEIKLALADLDTELNRFGEMVGTVLIVGGPDIVPFHRLPNPVDDSDLEIPSDNPYATRDENYFIPEWSVGRLPDDTGCDPKFLVGLIEKATSYHHKNVTEKSKWMEIWHRLQSFLTAITKGNTFRKSSYGYSAAVWRRASLSVFRPIGDPQNLWVSPPYQVDEQCSLKNPNKPCLTLPPGKFAYFNLHGLPDTDEWYGQRDPTEPGEMPDFPLALRAAEINQNGNGYTPQIIFSEACFGAHILHKTVDEAIAFRFLASGSKAVVGSTCISYGSISNPLIAADLLGHTFWHYLKDGQPVGEALRRAKIHLTREMNKRQGYLDGEDQKSLLSFVLYGDPLVQAGELEKGPKITIRPNNPSRVVLTTCDRSSDENILNPVPEENLQQVKQLVSVYLPGMSDADLSLNQERTGCGGDGHACPSAQVYAKTTANTHTTGRQIVSLSKSIKKDSVTHTQYARITLDADGNVIKVTVSR